MKKRLLSTFLALAMVFSMVPSSLADNSDSITGPSGGQTYDSSAILTGSPNVIESLSGEFNKGQLSAVEIKMGSAHNGTGSVYVLIFTRLTDDDDWNDYNDWLNIDTIGKVIANPDPDHGTDD